MATSAIRIENLGKEFYLGTRSELPTLRDTLASSVGQLRRMVSSGLRGGWRRRPPESFWALRDVSIDVAEGEVIGIIGGNGAGKSTLLKILSQITAPTEGRVEINGRVGSLLEVGTGFHPELSGRENVFLNGAILGMSRREVVQKFDDIVAFAEIEKFIDTPVKHYSSGMYMRLAFAVAAHLEPEILIIDEVLAVGDTAFQKKCLGKMDDVAREGRTILFVSHNLLAIEGLCTRALRLGGGQLVDVGMPREVVARYLRESTTELTHRVWDAAAAPGNDNVRLRLAAVRPTTGTPGDNIDIRTEFVLEFEYWNFVSGARLNLNLYVYSDQGVMIFCYGQPGEPSPLAVGLHRDTCRVPAELMNSGTYTVEIQIVRNQSETVYSHKDVLCFRIADTAEGRGFWHGEWPGAVRPSLQWKTEFVASLSDAVLPRRQD